MDQTRRASGVLKDRAVCVRLRRAGFVPKKRADTEGLIGSDMARCAFQEGLFSAVWRMMEGGSEWVMVDQLILQAGDDAGLGVSGEKEQSQETFRR